MEEDFFFPNTFSGFGREEWIEFEYHSSAIVSGIL